MSTWKTVVVGVDGSTPSHKALAWAAAEAADHRADLVVVNVWEHTLPPPTGSVSVSERYVPDPSQRTAEDFLREIKEVLGEDPPVLVQPRRQAGCRSKGAHRGVGGRRPARGRYAWPRRLQGAGARLGQPACRRLRPVPGDRGPLTRYRMGLRPSAGLLAERESMPCGRPARRTMLQAWRRAAKRQAAGQCDRAFAGGADRGLRVPERR